MAQCIWPCVIKAEHKKQYQLHLSHEKTELSLHQLHCEHTQQPNSSRCPNVADEIGCISEGLKRARRRQCCYFCYTHGTSVAMDEQGASVSGKIWEHAVWHSIVPLKAIHQQCRFSSCLSLILLWEWICSAVGGKHLSCKSFASLETTVSAIPS